MPFGFLSDDPAELSPCARGLEDDDGEEVDAMTPAEEEASAGMGASSSSLSSKVLPCLLLEAELGLLLSASLGRRIEVLEVRREPAGDCSWPRASSANRTRLPMPPPLLLLTLGRLGAQPGEDGCSSGKRVRLLLLVGLLLPLLVGLPEVGDCTSTADMI